MAKIKDDTDNSEDLKMEKFLEKQKRIKKEINRLKKLFANIAENKKKLVFTTIDDVAFMTIEMQDLRIEIAKNGTQEEYQNGANQHGVKQSTAVQNYLQFSQKQTAAMKILIDQMPKTEAKKPEVTDDFDDFVFSRAEV